MKANEWLERGNQEIDSINAFSDFWRGFNNLFFNSQGNTERKKIRAYLSEKFPEKSAFQLLEANQERIDYLLSQPVIDMRGNGRDTSPNIEAFKLATTSLEKLQEIFMVIYQIRCNLEHGQKSPTRERDIELCKNASPFVAFAINQNA